MIYISLIFLGSFLPSTVWSYQKHHQSDLFLNHSQALIEDKVPYWIDCNVDAPGEGHDRPRPCILKNISNNNGCKNVQFDQFSWYQWLESTLAYQGCSKSASNGACYGLALAYIEWKTQQTSFIIDKIKRKKSTADFIKELTASETAIPWATKICTKYNQDKLGIDIEGFVKEKTTRPPFGVIKGTTASKTGVAAAPWSQVPVDGVITPSATDYQWDFTQVLQYYGSPPVLLIYYVEDEQHTLAILKTKNKYRFFDSNAGIISCNSVDTLETAVHQYLRHEKVFPKYTAFRKIKANIGKKLDFQLHLVYTKEGANKTQERIDGEMAYYNIH